MGLGVGYRFEIRPKVLCRSVLERDPILRGIEGKSVGSVGRDWDMFQWFRVGGW